MSTWAAAALRHRRESPVAADQHEFPAPSRPFDRLPHGLRVPALHTRADWQRQHEPELFAADRHVTQPGPHQFANSAAAAARERSAAFHVLVDDAGGGDEVDAWNCNTTQTEIGVGQI